MELGERSDKLAAPPFAPQRVAPYLPVPRTRHVPGPAPGVHQHTERVVPNVKSAEKRVRTNEKRRERNRRDRSRMRTAIKKVRQADSAEVAADALREASSLLDRAASSRVILL